MRLLNLKAGFSSEDDQPPDILFKPLKDGDTKWELRDYFGEKISREDVMGFLGDYYEERGWSRETGVPAEEKLRELGLEDST